MLIINIIKLQKNQAASVGFEPTMVFTHQINSLDRSATTATKQFKKLNMSGYQDSNLGHLAPKASTLPDCATSRN